MRSEAWRPAAAARNRSPREARDAPGEHYDSSLQSLAQNRHGGAPRGERPASWDARRLASAWHAALWRAPRVFRRAPQRLSALRPPLDSGWRSKVANPGRKNAPREREDLGCLKSE